MEKILSEKEVATELGLSYWTVRKLRLQCGLPHFRTAGKIFYRLSSVTVWMAQKEADCQDLLEKAL